MDEPLGSLDAEFRDLMRDELRQLHTRINATTVYVTHDQLEAMSMGDKIAVMNAGDVEQFGTPRDVYERPATMFVANFIGSPPMNLMPVSQPHARGQDHVMVDGAPIKVPTLADDTASESLIVGVRPEHIELKDNDSATVNTIAGRVFESEYLGTTQIVTVDTSLGRVKARVPARVTATPGEQVRLSPMTDRISLFDQTSGRAMRRAAEAQVIYG
jgi:multiple sugar transport system ATP-binding protein